MTFNNYWRLIVKNKTTTKNKQTLYKKKIQKKKKRKNLANTMPIVAKYDTMKDLT